MSNMCSPDQRFQTLRVIAIYSEVPKAWPSSVATVAKGQN